MRVVCAARVQVRIAARPQLHVHRRGPERVVPPARSSEGGTDEPHGERDLCGEARCMRGRVVNSTNKKKPQQKLRERDGRFAGTRGGAPDCPPPAHPVFALRCQSNKPPPSSSTRQAGLPVLPTCTPPPAAGARVASAAAAISGARLLRYARQVDVEMHRQQHGYTCPNPLKLLPQPTSPVRRMRPGRVRSRSFVWRRSRASSAGAHCSQLVCLYANVLERESQQLCFRDRSSPSFVSTTTSVRPPATSILASLPRMD